MLLLVVALTTLSAGFAQEKKGKFAQGDVIITGSLGVSATKVGELKTTVTTFAPKVGYFVTENIAAGIQGGLGLSKGKMGDVDAVDAVTYNAGLFGRYYVSPKKPFSVFAELGVNYVGTTNDFFKSEGSSSAAKMSLSGISAAFGPGINYFIAKNFAIEAGLGVIAYSNQTMDLMGSEVKTSAFGLKLDLSKVNFGLVYKF